MPTKVDFKRTIRDHAKLEGEATISIGTTTFTGDSKRLFLNFNDVGMLFSHDDAQDFLKAAMAAYLRLGYGVDSESQS